MKVYAVIIVEAIDDYKHRGESPSADVTIFDNYSKCYNYINEYIVKCTTDYINDIEDEKIPESIKEYFNKDPVSDRWEFKDIKKEEGTEDTEKEEGTSEDSEDSSYEECPFDKLYEYIAEGEYVPYTWTYEIKELEVN